MVNDTAEALRARGIDTQSVGEILDGHSAPPPPGAFAPARSAITAPGADRAPSWREHPSYPGYLVSEDGHVAKIVPLTPQLDKSRYHQVVVRIDGKKKHRGVASMVLETFVGPRPTPTHQARHLNCVREDNRLTNLAWGTPKENAADSLAAGTRARGERVGVAKLTADRVRHIRAHGNSENAGALAVQFGVSRSTVMGVINGKVWAHVE